MDLTPDDKERERALFETPTEKDNLDQDPLVFEEIVVEELAIDGICGVY